MGVTSLRAALFIVIIVRTTNPLACHIHYLQDFETVLRDDVRAVLELQLSVLLCARGRWRPVTAITTKLVFTSNYRERWLHTLILDSLHRRQHNPIYTNTHTHTHTHTPAKRDYWNLSVSTKLNVQMVPKFPFFECRWHSYLQTRMEVINCFFFILAVALVQVNIQSRSQCCSYTEFCFDADWEITKTQRDCGNDEWSLGFGRVTSRGLWNYRQGNSILYNHQEQYNESNDN